MRSPRCWSSRRWSSPTSIRLTGTLYSFAIFALAFIARPIGSLIFIVDRPAHGRGVEADDRAVPARRIDRGDGVPARLRAGRRAVGAGCSALFRIGQGIALGGAWDGLPSLLSLNAPREPARLVCDDPAARRAARADRGERRCSPSSCRRCRPRTSSTGAGAIRSSSPSRSTSSRCSRGCGWSRRPNSSALFESRELQPSPPFATRCAANGARSCSARSRRSPASRCSTWSRCSRCPG